MLIALLVLRKAVELRVGRTWTVVVTKTRRELPSEAAAAVLNMAAADEVAAADAILRRRTWSLNLSPMLALMLLL